MARIGIFFLLAAALMTGLWALLRPIAQAPAPTATAAPAAPATPSTAEGGTADIVTAVVVAPRRFTLEPGNPAAPKVMQVQVGEEVELSITTGSDDELHLHGYDLALPLRAGEPGTLRFVAEHAGRFELELHHAHAEIGVLEVLPR
ncbi:MAG TPA: hypothetical protein VGE51_16585 [Fontimonas sp.]